MAASGKGAMAMANQLNSDRSTPAVGCCMSECYVPCVRLFSRGYYFKDEQGGTQMHTTGCLRHRTDGASATHRFHGVALPVVPRGSLGLSSCPVLSTSASNKKQDVQQAMMAMEA